MESATEGCERQAWEEAVRLIYDAALGVATWCQALDGIRHCVQADAACLRMRRPGGEAVVRACVAPADTSCSCAVGCVGGRDHNEIATTTIESRRGGHAARRSVDHRRGDVSAVRSDGGERIAGDEPHSLPGDPMVCGSGVEFVLDLQRRSHSPSFGDAELSTVKSLMRHVERALELAERMDHGALVARVVEAMPGVQMPGLLLLDADGRVLFLNRVAEEILARQKALTLCDGRLCSPSKRQQQWLDAATEVGHRDGSCPDGWRRCARFTAHDGGGDLALSLLPWHDAKVSSIGRLADAVTLGVLTSLEGGSAYSEPLIQSLFGLSVGEARLVTALVGTGSLTGAAQELDIRPSTARDRLKTVFRKTGFNSQCSVVAAVLRSPTRKTETRSDCLVR